MTTLLREQVRILIEASEALKANPSEQWFWQVQVKVLDLSGLTRLKEVLEFEQKEAARIHAEGEARLLKIDQDHVQELENFKRVDMPRFLKQWEAAAQAKEAPEEILKNI